MVDGASGPADRAGIKEMYVDQHNITHGGDIIIGLDGHPINDLEQYISYIENHKAVGENIVVRLNRQGQTLEVITTLVERPLDSPSEQSILSNT